MEGIRGRSGRYVCPTPKCHCGLSSSMKTSWTDNNLARRFVVCPLREVEGCGFWQWYNPEMCARSRDVIPGLLRRINSMENHVETLENEVKLWRTNAKKMEIKLDKLEFEHMKTKRKESYLFRSCRIFWFCGILTILIAYGMYTGEFGSNLALTGE